MKGREKRTFYITQNESSDIIGKMTHEGHSKKKVEYNMENNSGAM
jgi:hypothetical protein